MHRSFVHRELTHTLLALLWAWPLLGFGSEPVAKDPIVRALAELTDGSRLAGRPQCDALRVDLGYAAADIPLASIRTLEHDPGNGRVVLALKNGDSLTGTLLTESLPMETLLGPVALDFALIDRLAISAFAAGELPPGEGPIAFGGVNWVGWRTMFEVRGNTLHTLPKARPGFNYGHGGHGRSAVLTTNIGSKEWTDYSVQLDLCMSSVDPSFNPYGLSADQRGAVVMFHIVDAKESWNEAAWSMYELHLYDGRWALYSVRNRYTPALVGYDGIREEGQRKIAEGTDLKFDEQKGNTFRIDVVSNRIQLWMDGRQMADLVDETMHQKIQNTDLGHGGFGVYWIFESMGWIRNFSARRL